MRKIFKIAISSGDPAGIGPEILTKMLKFHKFRNNCAYVVLGNIFSGSIPTKITEIQDISEAKDGSKIYWLKIHDKQVASGEPSGLSGKIAYNILEKAVDLLLRKKIDAIVTCPVSKTEIRKTRPDFIGHTEFFAERAKTGNFVMSFWGPHFNLALLTTHLSLAEVTKEIVKMKIINKLKLIVRETRKILPEAKFALLAVNPHAGEKGAFGEEDMIISEILHKLENAGIKIDGPFPADNFFISRAGKYDMIISAYHDQGLIPFKSVSSENGVNVTLGLPFIRTSVDHGTAFDIAGKNIASEKSLEAALVFAEEHLLGKEENRSNSYKFYAEFYDRSMEHVNYREWIGFILNRFMSIHSRNPEYILELACGTAAISSILVRKGLKVDASDISPEMLKIADQKKIKPNLFHRNILDRHAKAKYDLIVLLFDSFNYLKERSEVMDLLENIHYSLQDKGIFIFDISTKKNCEENFDGFIDLIDEDDKFLIHRSDYDEVKMIQKTHLTFFHKKDFLFERNEEIHLQKIFPVEQVSEMIEESKLDLLGIYNLSPFKKIDHLFSADHDYSRLFFVLQKNVI